METNNGAYVNLERNDVDGGGLIFEAMANPMTEAMSDGCVCLISKARDDLCVGKYRQIQADRPM